MATTYSAEDLVKVAGPRATFVTVEEAATLLEAPSGSRPRVYALWQDQVVKVASKFYLDRYAEEAVAVWVSGTTLEDLVRPA